MRTTRGESNDSRAIAEMMGLIAENPLVLPGEFRPTGMMYATWRMITRLYVAKRQNRAGEWSGVRMVQGALTKDRHGVILVARSVTPKLLTLTELRQVEERDTRRFDELRPAFDYFCFGDRAAPTAKH